MAVPCKRWPLDTLSTENVAILHLIYYYTCMWLIGILFFPKAKLTRRLLHIALCC